VPDTDDVVQCPVRIERRTVDMLKLTSGWWGRSLNSELQLALRAHVHASLLALLKDPVARADPELKARLEAEPDFADRVKRDLGTLYQEAFSRTVPTELLGEFDEAA
jgi:hypothetical protein